MNRRNLFKFIACTPIALPAVIKVMAWERYVSGSFSGQSFIIGESGGEAILPRSRFKIIAEKFTISSPVVSSFHSVEAQMLEHDLFEPIESLTSATHRSSV